MKKKRNKGMNNVVAATIAFTTLVAPTSAVFADENDNGMKNESGNDSVILNEQQSEAQNRLIEVEPRTSPNRFERNSLNYQIEPSSNGLAVWISTTHYFENETVKFTSVTSRESQTISIGPDKMAAYVFHEPLKAGDIIQLELYGAQGVLRDTITFTVPFNVNMAPDKPVLNPVKDTDEYITGRVEKPSPGHVVAIQGGQKIPVASDGTFRIPISKQPAGTVLTVYSYHNTTNTKDYSTSSVTVEKTEAEAAEAPKVNEVTDADTVVTGTAKANSIVMVEVGDSIIGAAQAGADGTYRVNIPKQPAGTELSVTASYSAGKSPATKVTVSATETVPTAPEVNGVTDVDTTVTGTAKAGSTVSIKVGNQEIGQGQ
ncbi:Ig-like domain-containing protein, partial [Bacillus cereus]